MNNSAGKTAGPKKNSVKTPSHFLLIALLWFAVSGALSCKAIDKTAWKGPTPVETEKDLPATTPPGNEIEEIYLEGGTTGILMIHGYSSTCLSLEPLAKALNQRGYTIYCVLLPGHGKTVEALDVVEKEDYYDFIDKRFEEFSKKSNSTYVMGYSLGASLAVHLAAEYEIHGIILIGMPVLDVRGRLNPRSLHYAATLVTTTASKLGLPKPKYFFRRDYCRRYNEYVRFSEKGANVLFEVIENTQDAIGEFDEPVLFLQSKKDPYVKQSSIEYVMRKVKSRIKKTVYFDVVSHNIFTGGKMPLVVKEIHDFIDLVEKSKPKRPADNSRQKQ